MPYFFFGLFTIPSLNSGKFTTFKATKDAKRTVERSRIPTLAISKAPSLGYRPDKQVPDLFPTWEKQVNMRLVDSALFRFPKALITDTTIQGSHTSALVIKIHIQTNKLCNQFIPRRNSET